MATNLAAHTVFAWSNGCRILMYGLMSDLANLCHVERLRTAGIVVALRFMEFKSE